jgi:hypothetical protein
LAGSPVESSAAVLTTKVVWVLRVKKLAATAAGDAAMVQMRKRTIAGNEKK